MRIRAKHVSASLVVLSGLLVFSFWLVFLSPVGYEAPEDKGLFGEPPHKVFVYGTLTHSIVRRVVIGQSGDPRPAVLSDFRREGLSLVREEGSRTQGLLLTVDTPQLRRLDRYERLGVRYDRLQVELEDGTQAWVYIRRLTDDANSPTPRGLGTGDDDH